MVAVQICLQIILMIRAGFKTIGFGHYQRRNKDASHGCGKGEQGFRSRCNAQ
jgi:hypothetical protein